MSRIVLSRSNDHIIDALGLRRLLDAGMVSDEGVAFTLCTAAVRVFVDRSSATDSAGRAKSVALEPATSPADAATMAVSLPVIAAADWRRAATVGEVSLLVIAARHAVWSAILGQNLAGRFSLRAGHVPLLADRDRNGVLPTEPYTIDLAKREPSIAWHILRILLRMEPSAQVLHAFAVLQECDRVAAVMERTTGIAGPVAIRKSHHKSHGAILRDAQWEAERLLHRYPKAGQVFGGNAWDETAAERYLVRQMTWG